MCLCLPAFFIMAGLFEMITYPVKELRKKGNIKVKKKEVCLALILRVSKKNNRVDGRQVVFSRNTCMLLNRKSVPYGTRVFGPVLKEFRKQKKIKLLMVSSSHF